MSVIFTCTRSFHTSRQQLQHARAISDCVCTAEQVRCMRRVSGIVPRRRVLGMCRWLIERSHSQLVSASVLGRLRGKLRTSVIVWRLRFPRELRTPTTSPSRINVLATKHESAMSIITIKNSYESKQHVNGQNVTSLSQLYHLEINAYNVKTAVIRMK